MGRSQLPAWLLEIGFAQRGSGRQRSCAEWRLCNLPEGCDSHQYLLWFGLGSGPLHVLTSASIALAGALAVSFGLLQRNAIVALILLGRPYPPKLSAAPSTARSVTVP
jgi:hypothetical protein